MAGAFADRLFEAKLRLARSGELAELRMLEANERLGAERLRGLQQRRAAEIVRFAAGHSAFHRERLAAAGLSLRDLDDPQAFYALPIMERADVREQRERIRTDEATPANVQHVVTGGTTGEPLRVMRDERANHRVLGWRLHRWWGVAPADNRAVIWRDATKDPWKTLRHEALWWPTRTVSMDANCIDTRSTAKFLDAWERTRPALLTGYVGAVLELARLLVESGRRIPAPKAIGLTSASVTPAQKRSIGEAFGAPAYDHYQCVECPMLAGECARSDGLHVFADSRLVEILDAEGRPAPPGETGNVVVTDFRNRVFPLIRYRLGDWARWKEGVCPCGVTFPLLEPVAGRMTDVLRLPSGVAIAGIGMCAIFHAWPDAVRQFQVRQAADYSLTLQCVRGSDPNADAIMQRVAESLREKTRHEVPVRLEVVDVIHHVRGKQYFVVSEAPSAPSAG